MYPRSDRPCSASEAQLVLYVTTHSELICVQNIFAIGAIEALVERVPHRFAALTSN